MKKTVPTHAKDTHMVAFGAMNFMTAIVCYLTLFDAKGTFSPPWNSVLG
jgi:hypothetical protein